MAKRLTGYVTVGSTTYGPDDEVPADVLSQIDAPGVFEGEDDEPKPAPRGRKSE